VLARAADANVAGHLGKGSAGCRGAAPASRGVRAHISVSTEAWEGSALPSGTMPNGVMAANLV
jgi:hypothetical protein